MSKDILFADKQEKAEEKYKLYRDEDPFPEIEPALLNSADIKDYVRYTGMIHPFYPSDEYFKPASYSIRFSGNYLYWDFIDGKPKKKENKLKEGESFVLKSNSIAYISLEPYFRLPNYVAARFNLQIKHVYRGLLLGTGPLVDPGFCGSLNIPLHNLTGEDYEIKHGDPIIWMEFTKLSKNSRWIKQKNYNSTREGEYVEFKRSSTDRKLNDYIHLAEPNTPIQSSLPKIIDEYSKVLGDSKKINKRTDSLLKWFSVSIFLGIAGIIAAVGGYYYNVYTLGKSSETKIDAYQQDILDLQSKIDNLNKRIDSLDQINNQSNAY